MFMHPQKDASSKFRNCDYRSAVVARESAGHEVKKGGVFHSEGPGQVGLKADYEGQAADRNAIECVNEIKASEWQRVKYRDPLYLFRDVI
jgi:hypothetical protein